MGSCRLWREVLAPLAVPGVSLPLSPTHSPRVVDSYSLCQGTRDAALPTPSVPPTPTASSFIPGLSNFDPLEWPNQKEKKGSPHMPRTPRTPLKQPLHPTSPPTQTATELGQASCSTKQTPRQPGGVDLLAQRAPWPGCLFGRAPCSTPGGSHATFAPSIISCLGTCPRLAPRPPTSSSVS